MTSQRDGIYTLSPPFLRVDAGERYCYNLGLASDAILQKMQEGVAARLPGVGTPTALPYLGADRVMVQGPGESNDAFARRLSLAFPTWQHAGSRPAILRQALGYVGAESALFNDGQWITGAIVRASGGGAYASWSYYFNIDDFINDEPTDLRVAPANWNWDGEYRRPQAFLILYFPIYDLDITGGTASIDSTSGGFATISGLSGLPALTDANYVLLLNGTSAGANDGYWQVSSLIDSTSLIIAGSEITAPDANNGSITWALFRFPDVGPGKVWDQPGEVWDDPNRCWDLNKPAGYVQQIQALVRRWKSAGTFYPSIIFSFYGGSGNTASQLSPYGVDGTNNPDGTWGEKAKIVDGVYVNSRQTNLTTRSPERWLACADGSARYYPDCYLPSGT